MFLYILFGVVVAGSLVCWIFNKLTENESKKHNELIKKTHDIDNKIKSLNNTFQRNIQNLKRKFINELSEELLLSIREYRKEKESIEKDLLKLKDSINEILKRKDTSPYLYKAIKRELVYLEDAINKLYAYYRYLAWFEGKVKICVNKKDIEGLLQLDVPQPLLPSDWIYVGKLILLDNKEEINMVNKYRQKIALSSVPKKGSDGYDDEIEKEAFEKYETDIPLLIVKESKNIYADSNDISYGNAPVKFWGSVLKGELYYNHIIRNIPFIINAFDEKLGREENSYYYKNAIKVTMKSCDKKFPLKRYHDTDEIYVYPVEYDLTLKKIRVTERIPQEENISDLPIYIAYNDDINTDELENAFLESNYKIYVSNYDNLKGNIIFKAGQLLLKCLVGELYLFLEEVYPDKNSSNILIELPFSFDIVPIQSIKDNANLLYSAKDSIIKMIEFINREFTYFFSMSKDARDDYEFFEKWLSIIEYQIKKEEINYKDLTYKEITFIENEYLIVNLANSYENKNQLSDIDQRLNPKSNQKKLFHNIDIKVAFELRFTKEDRFLLHPIGVLYDYDIDRENIIIKIKLDSYLPENTEFAGTKKIFLGLYQYPAALIRQKKALINFQRGEMVNQELKRMLITPELISKSVDIYEEEAFDKNIVWQNTMLTNNQKEVIKKSFLEKNFFIIQGPPGTGKTTIIKEIIYQFLKNNPNKKCLIVSQQNTAVDNALSRIYRDNKEEWFDKKTISMVRVAVDSGKVEDDIQPFIVDNWFKTYKNNLISYYKELFYNENDNRLQKFAMEWYQLIDKDNISEIDREIADVLLSNHQIVGATCVGFANKRLGIDRSTFDLAIIDEAARSTLPELLIPILRSKKVILIGDHYQLPPTVSKSIIDDIENLDNQTIDFLKKSFFEKLFESTPDTNKEVLVDQFRMPKEVGNMISKLFYEGKLKNGIEKTTEQFISPQTIKWIDVKGKNEIDGNSRYNKKEALAIRELLIKIQKQLSKNESKEVAIITPYSAQKKLLQKVINNLKNYKQIENLQIKCDTVDHFQGQEADIVIYSCVRTEGNLSFLIDKKRLNVALSRVRENLYIVGHKEFLYNAKVDNVNFFKQIIDYIEDCQNTTNGI